MNDRSDQPFKPPTSPEMQKKLRDAAARHGYISKHGRHTGQGNPSEFILALDVGEIATILLDNEERWQVIAWIERQVQLNPASDIYYALQSLASQLRDAAEREQKHESEELTEYITPPKNDD